MNHLAIQVHRFSLIFSFAATPRESLALKAFEQHFRFPFHLCPHEPLTRMNPMMWLGFKRGTSVRSLRSWQAGAEHGGNGGGWGRRGVRGRGEGGLGKRKGTQ